MRSDSIGDVRAKSKAFLSFTYIKFKLKILSLVTHKKECSPQKEVQLSACLTNCKVIGMLFLNVKMLDVPASDRSEPV